MASLLTMPAISKPDIAAAADEISPGELSQRVAILKRFRELLKAQRDRFRAYLDTLDKQQETIQKGSADDLLNHVRLEEKIVEDIFSIQKVIDRLEEMYHSVKNATPGPQAGEDEVVSLKESLKALQDEAIIRSEQNREFLAKRMTELRSEIKSLKANPYNQRISGFAPAPSQIDIKG